MNDITNANWMKNLRATGANIPYYTWKGKNFFVMGERNDYRCDLLRSTLPEDFFRHKRVVDIGCNLGRMIHFVVERGAISSKGLEYDVQTCAAADKIVDIEGVRPKVSIVNCDLSVDKITEKFDIAICFSVLHHINPRKNVIDFLNRYINESIIIEAKSFEAPYKSSYATNESRWDFKDEKAMIAFLENNLSNFKYIKTLGKSERNRPIMLFSRINLRIGSPIGSQGLGDILMLTAICRHNPNCTVELTPESSKYACLFEGICRDIVITDDPFVTPEVGTGTFLEKKLRACGFESKSPLPYIKLTDQEKREGLEFAKQFNNPIVFVPNCSLKWKGMREMDKEKWIKIIDRLKNKYTFLQFGLSNNFTKFENTIPLMNVPLRTQAKQFYGVKKYLGVDTGDRYIMSGVGGRCVVLHPKSNDCYNHADWHFSKDTIEYIEFDHREKVYDYL